MSSVMTPAGIALNPGEEVLAVALPSRLWSGVNYLYTLGLWEFWRRRRQFVVTNQRVVTTQGIVVQRSMSLPLGRIQDVDVTSSIVGGAALTLSSAGGGLGVERIGPLNRAEGEHFAATLQRAIFDAQGSSPA